MAVGKEITNDGPDFGSTCGVYYAASTIPGAGYGLFAGKDFEINDWIMPGDLVVPIVEINWHNEHEDYANLWEDYQWSARRYVRGAVSRVCVDRANKQVVARGTTQGMDNVIDGTHSFLACCEMSAQL
jgi:hypothetical protein